MGEALGSSEEAARKRIHRALERLQTLLTARGIGTTPSALAILCEAHGTATLPNGFAERLAQVSLAAKATPVDLAPTARPATPGVTPVALKVVLVGAGLGVVLIARILHPASPLAGLPLESVGCRGNPRRFQEHRSPTALRSASRGPAESAGKVVPDAEVQTILERLRSALYASDSAPDEDHARPSHQGRHRRLARPTKHLPSLLGEALADSRPVVVVRAAAGVAILGPDAREAGPELLRALQSNTHGHTLMGLGNALAQLGPEPSLLPGLVDALRNKPQHGLGLAEGFPPSQAESIAPGPPLTPLLRDPEPRASRRWPPTPSADAPRSPPPRRLSELPSMH